MKTHMPRCHSSNCRSTRQKVIALMRLHMLTGCTMLSQLLMYLAEGRPDPVVDNLVSMHIQDAKVTVCPNDCGGCHDRFNLS